MNTNENEIATYEEQEEQADLTSFSNEMLASLGLIEPEKTPALVEDGFPDSPSMRVMVAYQEYLDMGSGRKIAALARKFQEKAKILGKHAVPTTSAATLYYWKKQYDWDLQIRADEMTMLQEKRAARRQNARTLIDQHTNMAKVMQRIGMSVMRGYVDEKGNLTEHGKSAISAAEARKLLTDGMKLESQLLGMDNENEEDTHGEITY